MPLCKIKVCHYVKLNKNSNFGEQTIELVDEGSWTLWFGYSNKNKTIKYALNTGEKYYLLDKNGGVISVEQKLDNFSCERIARFKKLNTRSCI